MAVKEIMGIKVHPAANAFPLLTGKAFNQLVKSVEKHGLRNGILLKHPPEMGGKKFPCILLDGRNRLRAWEKLVKYGKARRSEWKDNVCYADHLIDTDDEAAVRQLIHDLNIHRRHLTADQKAAATAILNGKKWDEEKGKAGRPKKSFPDLEKISESKDTTPAVTSKKLAKLASVSVAAARRIEYIRNAEAKKLCPAGTLQKIADGELKAIDVEREIKKKAKKAPAKPNPAKAKAKPKKEVSEETEVETNKARLKVKLADLVADWKNADHSLTELKALLLKLAARCD
jgi:hypothetical protein